MDRPPSAFGGGGGVGQQARACGAHRERPASALAWPLSLSLWVSGAPEAPRGAPGPRVGGSGARPSVPAWDAAERRQAPGRRGVALARERCAARRRVQPSPRAIPFTKAPARRARAPGLPFAEVRARRAPRCRRGGRRPAASGQATCRTCQRRGGGPLVLSGSGLVSGGGSLVPATAGRDAGLLRLPSRGTRPRRGPRPPNSGLGKSVHRPGRARATVREPSGPQGRPCCPVAEGTYRGRHKPATWLRPACGGPTRCA